MDIEKLEIQISPANNVNWILKTVHQTFELTFVGCLNSTNFRAMHNIQGIIASSESRQSYFWSTHWLSDLLKDCWQYNIEFKSNTGTGKVWWLTIEFSIWITCYPLSGCDFPKVGQENLGNFRILLILRNW